MTFLIADSEVRVHDVCHLRHAHGPAQVRLADEQLRPRHQVAQLQPRDLAAERVVQADGGQRGVPVRRHALRPAPHAQGLHHGKATVGAAEQHLR